jgi:nucleoid-associated protein YgaU
VTTHNLSFELADTTYQAALERARQEGRTLSAVLEDMIDKYAHGALSPSMATYVVQPGDSLARIARKVYGDPHKYLHLQKANNLADPGQIWVDQVLVVPLDSQLAPPDLPPAPPLSPDRQ